MWISRPFKFPAVVFLWFASILCTLCPDSYAVEFAFVGARAVGMGGAGVAVTTDAFATYWNPAGLAMSKTFDIRAQVSGQAIDRMGLLDTIKDINDLNASSSPAQAQALANRLNQPGTNVSGIGTAGLYVKGYFGDHAFGFNVSDVATGGAFVASPITTVGNTVNGQLGLRALEARQAAFSYAYAFADRTFAIGVTGKIIQGAAYSSLINVNSAGDTAADLANDFGKAKLSTAFGIDVGALYRPSSWLRVGIVAKDINQPTFDAPGGGEFKLTPQVRSGVAVNPWETMTITFDADLNANHTLTPGIKSQVLSLGAEQTILNEFLSLRIGAFKNVQDANSVVTPTAGIGLRIFALRVDVGGGYDFRERGALASGTAAFTF
jgi:hypothetical protein